MKKLVCISGAASPHMVKFIPYMSRYFDTEFYFYEMPLSGRRADWWRIDLGPHGHIPKVNFSFKGKLRYSRQLEREVKEFNPDIIMIGGFLDLSSYVIYRWAKQKGKYTLVFTEATRNLRTRKLNPYSFPWKIVHFLYRDIDRIVAVQPQAYAQFKDSFRFGDKVVSGRYPCDLDSYFNHPIRTKKDSYTLIFPNRLTENYNPMAALEIFAIVLKRFPKTRLWLNASGELRSAVERRIHELDISASVDFLDNIKRWEDLGVIYAQSDIMIFPAKYSTGNYTIAECMASGMACLISDRVTFVSRPDDDVNSGIDILPLDLKLWADRVCWYIENPGEFARLAPINRQVQKSQTMTETARFYFDLIDSDLGRLLCYGR